MNEQTYHIARNGEIIGAHKREEIAALWGIGILPGDHFLSEGESEWRPVSELGEGLGLPALAPSGAIRRKDYIMHAVGALKPRLWIKPVLIVIPIAALSAWLCVVVPEQISLYKEKAAQEAAQAEAARREQERLAQLAAEHRRQEQIKRQEAARIAEEQEAKRIAEEAEAKRIAQERAAKRAELLQDGADNLRIAKAHAKADVAIRKARKWRMTTEERIEAERKDADDDILALCIDYYQGGRDVLTRGYGNSEVPVGKLDVDAREFSRKLELAQSRVRASELNPDSVNFIESHIERIALSSDLHFHAWGKMESKNKYGVAISRTWCAIIDDTKYVDERTGVVHVPACDSVGGERVTSKAWNSVPSKEDEDGGSRPR